MGSNGTHRPVRGCWELLYNVHLLEDRQGKQKPIMQCDVM